MAITPITARINVQVIGQQVLNTLASTYRLVGNAANQAAVGVRAFNTVQTTVARGMMSSIGIIGRVAGALNQYSQNIQQGNRHTAAFGGSIINLTKSMVLFSVLLPLVRLPQTAIQS